MSHDCCHDHEDEHCHCHNHEETSCGCGHCHGEKENGKLSVIILASGVAVTALTFLPFINVSFRGILLAAVTAVCGFPVFRHALKAIKNKEIGETVLLFVAVIAAVLLGEFFEAAMVTVLFRIGELLEEFAEGRSRKSVESIYSIVSDTANLVMPDGSYRKIDADEIEKGMRLAVLPHEIVPADGMVVEGESSLDESSLTGESLPVAVFAGSSVHSGAVNGDSVIVIEASAGRAQSSAARIVELVDEATRKKGKAQRTVSVFAKYYTPIIIAAAVIIAVVPSLNGLGG